MDKDSPRNSYPFLLKEDLFSTYLNQKNLNFPSDPWKFSQEDFFFRPETNYFNKYFDNDRLSNISQGEQIAFNYNNEEKENLNQEDVSTKKKTESMQPSCIISKRTNNSISDLKAMPMNIISNNDNKIKPGQDISDNEIKLLKNRLSARKCRLKKKSYIKQLEEEVEQYRLELSHYKNNSKKEKSFENYIHLVDEQERELSLLTQKKKIEASKIEYLANQKILLNELFVRQIKLMMPIDCKLFQNKFLKMAQFENDDTVTVIFNKIITNIQM